jgi:hypothetical protein
VSHHAHDFEKSLWPLLIDRVTHTSQRHGATPHVGRKSVNELESLASFSCNPLSLLKVHTLVKSVMIQIGKPAHIKALGGYPDWVSIQKICTCFPLFQNKEGTIRGGCVCIAQITYFHSSNLSYLHKNKRLTTQATTARTPSHRQEGHWQLRKEHTTPTSLRSSAPGSRGHPPHPLSSPRCI